MTAQIGWEYERYRIRHDTSDWVEVIGEQGMAQAAQDYADTNALGVGAQIFVQPIPLPPSITRYTMTEQWVRWEGRA